MIKVTPQVVDKFVLLALTTNKRHPERSEGPPEFGYIFVKLRSFATLRMTYLGSYHKCPICIKTTCSQFTKKRH